MTKKRRDLLFVDVETTGLRKEDRVVTLGMVKVDGEAHADGEFLASFGHFIFNPGRPSDPRARKVHGYADEELAMQDTFREILDEVRPWFEGNRLIAAHNAPFDQRFILNEFEAAGTPLKGSRIQCTMKAFKQKTGGRGGLDVAIDTIGLNRRGKNHGALEDAWLAMNVHFWTQGLALPPSDQGSFIPPTNLRSRDAIVPPQIAAGAAILPNQPAWSEGQRDKLLHVTRPTAMLMAYLAFADGVGDQTEVSALAEYVETVRERLGLPSSEIEVQDVAAEHFATSPTEIEVKHWIEIILADESQKRELVHWLKAVGYADGSLSASESGAVQTITETIRNVLNG